jgi:hypothetical protein
VNCHLFKEAGKRREKKLQAQHSPCRCTKQGGVSGGAATSYIGRDTSMWQFFPTLRVCALPRHILAFVDGEDDGA